MAIERLIIGENRRGRGQSNAEREPRNYVLFEICRNVRNVVRQLLSTRNRDGSHLKRP